MIDLGRYWWPLATASELHLNKPLARQLHGIPLVLFRDTIGKPAALLDRCPHRHAPLSLGKLCTGKISCVYHGLEFDNTGECTRVPGYEKISGKAPRVRAYPVMQADGLVWVCTDPAASRTYPPDNNGARAACDVFIISEQVNCKLADAIENFLDPFHTNFIHAGWIRRDEKRQPVNVSVRRLPDGVEAHYQGEGRQAGLISRLLERERSQSWGRFRMPGFAEIEYHDRKGMTLHIAVWFTPETHDQIRVHACITTRHGILPGWFKAFVLRRLFKLILHQDKTILEQTYANQVRFDKLDSRDLAAAPVDGPQDFLGPWIRRLLAGESMQSFRETTTTVFL